MQAEVAGSAASASRLIEEIERMQAMAERARQLTAARAQVCKKTLGIEIAAAPAFDFGLKRGKPRRFFWRQRRVPGNRLAAYRLRLRVRAVSLDAGGDAPLDQGLNVVVSHG
jgi:hypothetical protein